MRLRTYRDPELPHDIKFFNMKMLFLITALCGEVTSQLKSELLMHLLDTLDLILKDVGQKEHADKRGAASSDEKSTLSVSTQLMF
jgi:hypothetical protein